ncbi:hypothetical protein THAOC_10269, partial [Thalassiosira oceanica]
MPSRPRPRGRIPASPGFRSSSIAFGLVPTFGPSASSSRLEKRGIQHVLPPRRLGLRPAPPQAVHDKALPVLHPDGRVRRPVDLREPRLGHGRDTQPERVDAELRGAVPQRVQPRPAQARRAPVRRRPGPAGAPPPRVGRAARPDGAGGRRPRPVRVGRVAAVPPPRGDGGGVARAPGDDGHGPRHLHVHGPDLRAPEQEAAGVRPGPAPLPPRGLGAG